MRSSSRVLCSVLALGALVAGCEEEVSYIRVSVYASEGSCGDAGLSGSADADGNDASADADSLDAKQELPDAAAPAVHSGAFQDAVKLKVEVWNATGSTTTLLYDHRSGDSIKCFDSTHPVTFSVSFDQGHISSAVNLRVTALGRDDSLLGAGQVVTPIVLERGAVVDADVQLARVFAGCDPAAMSGPDSCPSDQTCAIECSLGRGECVAAGGGGVGSLCQQSSDCQRGLECLSYCLATSVCVRPCHENADCGEDSFCTNPVLCGRNGEVPSGRFVCSLRCNPLGSTTGCPASIMYCGLIGTTETVDCVCKSPGQTGTDGTVCTSYSDCAPGHMCVKTGAGEFSCRALCKVGVAGGCPTGKSCVALSGYTIYGVCL